MEILYYFAERSTPMYQWQRTHFIDELKRHGIIIKVFNPALCNSFEESQERLLKEVENNCYDLLMTVSCNEHQILRSTIKEIKKKGIPTLCFRPDNLSVPMFDKGLAPEYDLIWLTAKETKYLYDKWGATSFFAPYAANPYRYTYTEYPLIRKACFIGTPHGSRARIINMTSKTGEPIDLFYGKNQIDNNNSDSIIEHKYKWWKFSPYEHILNNFRFCEGRKIFKGSVIERIKGVEDVVMRENVSHYPSLSFEKMVEYYSRYVLSLSFSSYGRTDVLKDNLPVVNLRNFEIPMCGGIQICRYCEELSQYYEEDKEIVFYRNEEELADKERFYLNKATNNQIKQMKIAARLRSENEHTWMCRFKKAFDILGLKY